VTVWWIIHHPIQYIKNCWVRLLSNYNIKYICTIYTRLDTCLMSISRFSLRDNVTLRLLKLYFYIAGVAEWSRVLDISWIGAAVYQWCEFKSRQGKNKKLSDLIPWPGPGFQMSCVIVFFLCSVNSGEMKVDCSFCWYWWKFVCI
jgi:hypothetical protein